MGRGRLVTAPTLPPGDLVGPVGGDDHALAIRPNRHFSLGLCCEIRRSGSHLDQQLIHEGRRHEDEFHSDGFENLNHVLEVWRIRVTGFTVDGTVVVVIMRTWGC